MGEIQFEPREGSANGKSVRNIVVQQAGFGPTAVPVYATVWPGHGDVRLRQGDIVALTGTYDRRNTQTEDGEDRTFHNLSVLRLAVLGHAASGEDSERSSSTPAEDEDDFGSDDDIPF